MNINYGNNSIGYNEACKLDFDFNQFDMKRTPCVRVLKSSISQQKLRQKTLIKAHYKTYQNKHVRPDMENSF